jgi:FkbM family methyltransferase
MNKLIRSLLLLQPQIYEFVYNIKNTHLINFYLKKVHEPDFKVLNLIFQEQALLFLDIGANVGMSALSIFTLKPQAKVISFEPNLINYPYLDKLVDKFSNFQYKQVGLGEQPGSLDFYYPIYNSKHMTALGSCDREQAEAWLNKNTVYFFDPNKLKIEKITIRVETLDSFCLQPDFIKIDVEGFEYQVLLGSENTISKYRPILLIEGVAKEDRVHLKMKDWGYEVFKFIDNQFYLNEFDCDNNFFIPQEKIKLVEPYLR